MVQRRHVAVLLLAVLTASSGCVGFVTGQSALTFSADQAKTSPEAAESAGYQLNDTRTQTIEREIEVAGTTRKVKAENQLAIYEKSVTIPMLGSAKLGVFAVVSTPAAEVAGRTFNPIGDYSNDRLVRLFAGNYGGMSDVEHVSNRTIRTLGTETTVSTYAATATFQGREVDVTVVATKLRHGDDFVVALGIFPQRMDGETENVLEMMRALDHPA